ncbi:hypothetical protein [Marinobacter sp. LN3S78]|uniref:hypothetical protein n=1 Tax=Marinobacter sp. LN3S78 TaxID=3382300 RepID=UPI00387B3FA4
MEIACIHIGLMKTATTYMQGVWALDEKIALSNKGLNPVVEYLRESTANNCFDVGKNLDIDLDQPLKAGQSLVLSSEGLSCGFLDSGDAEMLRVYQDNASRMMGTLASQTQNVLITLRSPVSWIRSMHAQFLNEGGSGSAREFLHERRAFLLQCLDLDYLLGLYRRYFRNVRILPYETLREGEGDFWASLGEMFSMPIPTARDVPVSNPSLSGQRLYVLSCLNGLGSHMRSVLQQSESYVGLERERLVQVSSHYESWLNRRFVEHASEAELERTLGWLRADTVPDDFRRFSISREFADELEKRYLSVVEEVTGDTKLVSRYRDELQQAITEPV